MPDRDDRIIRLHGNWKDDMPVDPDDEAERERRRHDKDSDSFDDESQHLPPRGRMVHDDD